jgi:hypothetical protein
MIAKFTHGNNFHGAVSYVNRSDLKTDARIIGYGGICLASNQAIADSFYLQSQMRPNTADPVQHISISFHPDDARRFPNTDEGDQFMYELVREWMREMKIRNTQYLIVRHHDHEYPHCHLLFNLVDNDGNVIDMSNDYQRNARVCKSIKLRHGLTFGKSDGRRIHADRLRGYAKHRHDILMAARSALATSKSWHDFRQQLARHGITLKVAIAKGGKINGVSYAMGDFRISGSKLDRRLFTYNHLAERFGNVETVAHKEAFERYFAAFQKAHDYIDYRREDWPRFYDRFPEPLSLGSFDPATAVPDSTDTGGTAHIDVGALLQFLAQAYDTHIPSYGGTDTSLDAYRKRDREQKYQPTKFKRR